MKILPARPAAEVTCATFVSRVRVAPIRVVYVHQDGAVTGSAISLRNLIAELDRDRYVPAVIMGREGPARQLFESAGSSVDAVPIRCLWTAPGPPFPKADYFRNWLALMPNGALDMRMRELAPALVHVNDKAPLAGAVSAKHLGVPVVWHLRSTYARTRSRMQARVSRHRIRALADHLIAISEDETDGFDDAPNLTIIRNSLSFDEIAKAAEARDRIRAELGIAPGEIVVGTVSTVVSERRGSFDFIRAAGLLRQRLPDRPLRFVMVAAIGNAEDHDAAAALATTCGIRDRLVMTGFRSDALSVMSAMDVVFTASRLGVLGRMPLEAMALAKPLVAGAGHSGRSRVVEDGVTALVVPPAAPEAAASALARVVQDAELARGLATRGRAYAAEHFDARKNALAVMQVYESLLPPR
jgi:glycosyltransferase involved in cell wall biosynthesis